MTVTFSLRHDLSRSYTDWSGPHPRVGEVVHFPGYCIDREEEITIESVAARVQWFPRGDAMECLIDLAPCEEIPEGFTP